MKKIFPFVVIGVSCILIGCGKQDAILIPEPLPAGAIDKQAEVVNFPESTPKIAKGYTISTSNNKGGVFYDGREIKNVDIETFKIIDDIYAKDKNAVYDSGARAVYYSKGNLVSPDVSTFEVVDYNRWVKDKESIYFLSDSFEYFGAKVEGADAATFEVVRSSWAKDKDFFYFRVYKITNSNTEAFEIMDDTYAKDKNTVYYGNNKITGADPQTFKIIGNGIYSKDKNSVFKYDQKIEGADPKTFTVPELR